MQSQRRTAHGHDDGHADAEAHGHGGHVGHESPPIMTYPLFALAGCTVLIGLVCLLAGPFWGTTRVVCAPPARHVRLRVAGHEEHHFDWLTAIVGTMAAWAASRSRYCFTAVPKHASRSVASGSGRSTRRRSQVLRRRALRMAGRPADPRHGGHLRVSGHLSGGWAGAGVAKIPRLVGREVLAAVPERPDPVLCGGLGALGGGLLLLVLLLLFYALRPLTWSSSSRIDLDGDIAGDHGPASRSWGAWSLVLMPQTRIQTATVDRVWRSRW